MKSTFTSHDRVSVQLPTLIHLAKSASVLKLGKHRCYAHHSGGYMSPFKGRGMEFDETRVYQAGDDVRSIDWRVTARSTHTHTKIYREEKERPVFISVDYRHTMSFATRGVFKSVQAAKLAALLAWSAHHHGDRIGGQLFSNDTCKELKPKNGRHSVLSFLNLLMSSPTNSTKETTLSTVLARLVNHARPGSLIYIISDFRGLDATAERHLAKLTRHCELILIHISDPLEQHLPKRGIYRFTDGNQDMTINTDSEHLLNKYQSQFQQRIQQLQSFSKKWQLTLINCSTTDDPFEVLR